MAGLIVALDTIDRDEARRWAELVAPNAGLIKLGLAFFCAHGPAGVRGLAAFPTFLDLKFCDIPNTVGSAVRAVLPLAPRMLTVHASGGAAMVEAARRASEAAGAGRPLVLAVTVLTSLDAGSLRAMGVADAPDDQVLRLGRMAIGAGADGLVCAPPEVAPLRAALGPEPVLVVPGIRAARGGSDDQARTMPAADAARAGADWLVVGRPITAAADVGLAASETAAAIRSA